MKLNCSNHRTPKVCFPSVQKLVGEKEEPIAPLTKEVANLNKQLEKMTKAQEKEAATLKVSCRYETDKNFPQSFDNILTNHLSIKILLSATKIHVYQGKRGQGKSPQPADREPRTGFGRSSGKGLRHLKVNDRYLKNCLRTI